MNMALEQIYYCYLVILKTMYPYAHATSNQADITPFRYQESEGSDFGEEEDDSDAEAPR